MRVKRLDAGRTTPTRLALVVTLATLSWSFARADEGETGLLRLVPADASAVLVAEGLRESSRVILGSPLAEGLAALPTVKAWRAAGGARQFERSRRDVEAALGVPLATLRDDIFGDATALVLRQRPGPMDPDRAEGMLLSRVRDRALLDRLLERVNKAELRDGPLREAAPRTHRGMAYTRRSFKPNTKADEYYAILPENLFVWTNSESLLQATIDRAGEGTGGLVDDPRYRTLRPGLPARPIALLLIDPRLLEQSFASTPEEKIPAKDRAVARLLRRGLAAVEYAGAALEWRDGPVLHLRQTIDPSKLDGTLRQWAERTATPTDDDLAPLLSRVPATSPLFGAGRIDPLPLFDLALEQFPADARPRVDALLTVVRGLLLGLDLRSDVLPKLGPGLVAYLDEPGAEHKGNWPLVAALAVAGDPADPRGVPAALDNALRTLLALMAVDQDKGKTPPRFVEQTIQGHRVASLEGGEPHGLSYTIGRGFVALGTSASSVAAFAARGDSTGPSPAFQADREGFFPDAGAFLYADLDRLNALASQHRESLERLLNADGDGPRDLDQALALMGLFRAAFISQRIEPGFRAIHHTAGLLPRPVKP